MDDTPHRWAPGRLRFGGFGVVAGRRPPRWRRCRHRYRRTARSPGAASATTSPSEHPHRRLGRDHDPRRRRRVGAKAAASAASFDLGARGDPEVQRPPGGSPGASERQVLIACRTVVTSSLAIHVQVTRRSLVQQPSFVATAATAAGPLPFDPAFAVAALASPLHPECTSVAGGGTYSARLCCAAASTTFAAARSVCF